MKKFARLVKFNICFPPKETTGGYMPGTCITQVSEHLYK